ncbi:MAG: VCBS repeat-containing protein [Bdellovibrionales bacterium]|nr:VCBS repeat-containing protein [Bdellovibrionales bacterium]
MVLFAWNRTPRSTAVITSASNLCLALLLSCLSPAWAYGLGEDYDGDGRDDLALYEPAVGTYSIRYSSTLEAVKYLDVPLGRVAAPLDRNGDGKTDPALFSRTTGEWWFIVNGSPSTELFGVVGDIPVPGKWSGNECQDLAVFTPRNNRFRYRNCVTNAEELIELGPYANPALPAPADYDGDGRFDAATWEPNEAWWLIRYSSGKPSVRFQFGELGDVPLPADFDGDGSAEPAIYRTVAQIGSEAFEARVVVYRESGAPSTFVWGKEDLKLQLADVSGDKKPDFLAHPSIGNIFHIRTSDAGDLMSVDFPFNEHYGFAAYPQNFYQQRTRSGDPIGQGQAQLIFAEVREASLAWYLFGPSGGGSWVDFGLRGDTPLLGDFAGYRRQLPTVVRDNNGFLDWYVRRDAESSPEFLRAFGLAGDKPFAGDLDCDGQDDAIVLRPVDGQLAWFWRTSGLSYADHNFHANWGLVGDAPFIADLNGDGCDELVAARPFAGAMRWFSFAPQLGVERSVDFGLAGDTAFQPVDFDGDGEDDPVVVRPPTERTNGQFREVIVQTGRRLPGESALELDFPAEGAIVAGHFSGTRFVEFGVIVPENKGPSFYLNSNGDTKAFLLPFDANPSLNALIAPTSLRR